MHARQHIFLAAGLVLGLLLAAACGLRKAQAPVTREFPMAEAPRMVTDPSQRMEWICDHFWDRFTATDSLYHCDTLTVNGVPKDQVEKQMGVLATLLEQIPLSRGQKAMRTLYDRLEAFQLAHPEGNVLPEVVGLASRYFYDPNSPVRSEDLYGALAEKLAASALIQEDYRAHYAWEAKACSLNRTGTVAADFTFIDTAGRRRTLHSVKAERTLLIFGNPDCQACRDLVDMMNAYPGIQAQISSGALKVVDVYIDEEIDLWRAHTADYPKDWICGYDPTFTIREDRLYSVRAIPSIYLLDAKKTVLVKDAAPEIILQALL